MDVNVIVPEFVGARNINDLEICQELSMTPKSEVDISDLLTISPKKMKLQSNMDQPIDEVEAGEQQQVITYSEDTPGSMKPVAAIYDSVMSDIFVDDYGLGQYLGRPVLISTGTFPVGSNLTTVNIDIWHSFLNTAAIKRKIDNFSYLQAKLKVKVIVNSTPFIYGAFGLSYHPKEDFNPISDDSGNPICLSQRPTIWIEPHKNSGGEMELPFFHQENWLKITSAADVRAMGAIKLWQLVGAQNASGNTVVDPSYSIYAWLENVRLAGSTVRTSLQSKDSEVRPAELANDEYGQGPVAKTATAVGTVAGYLTNVPIIGGFAKATELGASLVGTIASIFGFTNVPVIDNAAPYKSMPYHGLASSEISNVVDKLTIDPKNELSISPETVGLPAGDELAIQNMVTRESILLVEDWDTSDATDTSLVAMNVTPTWCEITTLTNATKLIDTPMGLASRLFSNWRGDIIVKVKLVASAYHRGRLRVSYDPTGDIYGVADSSHLVQTKIIDLEEGSDFQFRIPYMAPTSWLRVRDTPVADFSAQGVTAPTYDDDFHNGKFEIRVLNKLSSPVSTADAKLVISVRAADNFELSNPSEITFGSIGNPSPFTVQSNDAPVGGPMDESWDNGVTTFVMGKSTPPPKERYLVNMGEDIQSLRTLLRRSYYVNAELAVRQGTAFNGASIYRFTQTKYPPSYGYDPKGIHEAQGLTVPGTDFRFNYTSVNPYTWLSPCFIGQRGSMIWHFNTASRQHIDIMRVRRVTETSVTTAAGVRSIDTSVVNGNYYDVARASVSRFGSGAGGMSIVNQKTQAGLSVLVPQYSKYRFVGTNPTEAVLGRDEDDTENEKVVFEMYVDTSLAETATYYERYSSIGTDFNFFYFLNVPPRYIYTIPTAGTWP